MHISSAMNSYEFHDLHLNFMNIWFAYVKNAKFFHIIIATTSNGVVESSGFPQELGLQLDSNCRKTIPEKSSKSVFLPIFCWKTDAWKVLFEFYSSSDSHRSWTTPEGLKQLTFESYSISNMFVTLSSNDCGAMLPPRCPQGHFHFQEIHQDHQGIALDLKMTNCSISFWSKPNTLRSKHIEENKFGEKRVRILTPQRAKALWASYPGAVPKVVVCMQNQDGTTLDRKVAYPSHKKS